MHSSGKAEGNPSTCDTAKPLYRHLRRAPAAPRHALNGARRAHCTNAPPEHTSKKKKKKRDVVWTSRRERDMSDTYYGKEERFFLS